MIHIEIIKIFLTTVILFASPWQMALNMDIDSCVRPLAFPQAGSSGNRHELLANWEKDGLQPLFCLSRIRPWAGLRTRLCALYVKYAIFQRKEVADRGGKASRFSLFRIRRLFLRPNLFQTPWRQTSSPYPDRFHTIRQEHEMPDSRQGS